LTLLLLVWAMAYRLLCEREATAGEDVGW
jgi:hypothetical protein